MRHLLRPLGLLLAAGLACAGPAGAQSFPSHPIKFVVPFAPGGGTDVAARTIAAAMSTRLNTPVVVENKVGGGGVLGVATVRNAPADGYTALFHSSAVVVDQAMSNKADYDVRSDLITVGIPADADLGIFVHPSLPVNTVQELIDYAKARPGQLNYASGGIGTTIHMVFEELKHSKGFNMVHVPYSGGPAAVKAALSNEVQVLMLDAVYTKPHVDSGGLRLLATGGKERSPFYKSTPTVAEGASLPGYEANYWVGLFLPKGTDDAIVKRYRDTLEQSLADAAVRDKLLTLGLKVTPNSVAGAPARVASDLARWTKVIDQARIPKR